MQAKPKVCSVCGKLGPLWTSNPKQCKDCAGKNKVATAAPVKARAPISKVSDKQAKLNAIYNVAASQFKKDRPHCMARLHGCQGETHHVHHLYSGASRSKYYLDQREWLPVCNHCHHIIHDVLSMDDAINMGFKKIE